MLTKQDKKAVLAAIEFAEDRWNQSARNLRVKATAEDGSWDMSPAEAGRKLKAIEGRLRRLKAAKAKIE